MIEVEKIYRLTIKKMVKSLYKKNLTLKDLENLNTKNSDLNIIIKALNKGIGTKKVTIGLIREQLKRYPKQLSILDRIRN